MNQPTPPSGDRVNFPKAIGAAAQERRQQYRGGASGQSNSPPEALIALVQDLTQQNHQLRDRLAQMEAAEAEKAQATQTGTPTAHAAGGDVTDETANGTEGQVTYLLNQLEFAQQANQRQAIRIDSLAQQSNTDRLQLRQLERDNQAFQNRCRTQSNRIAELAQRCEELQQRLHRQQRYTLQLKAALDRCLEVPPPSYTTPDGGMAIASDGASVAYGIAEPAPPSPPVMPAEDTDATSLTSPLLPKPSHISPWSQEWPIVGAPSATPEPVESIAPLKPIPQVPQMSHFKMTLFNLAHQPQPAEADNMRANPEPSRSGSAAASEPEVSDPPPSPAIASPMAAMADGPTPATDDAFWTDLVQRVAELTHEQSALEGQGDRPESHPVPAIQSELPPPASRKPDRAAAHGEGVDTLFDVMLQGAKAIASQLRPSEPQSVTSQSSAAKPLPSPADPTGTSLIADEPPTTAPDAVRPAPPLESPQSKHSRIDLPTFLRPQPQ